MYTSIEVFYGINYYQNIFISYTWRVFLENNNIVKVLGMYISSCEHVCKGLHRQMALHVKAVWLSLTAFINTPLLFKTKTGLFRPSETIWVYWRYKEAVSRAGLHYFGGLGNILDSIPQKSATVVPLAQPMSFYSSRQKGRWVSRHHSLSVCW